MAETKEKDIWEELRKPFPKGTVGKLPKPTKQQTDEVKADYKKGTRCNVCGGWHHPNVVHLDYVGHAVVTDRLNTVAGPENWSIEPIAFDANGNPLTNAKGELWCKLTIMGASKLCVGDGDPSSKVLLGDALRNGAMRFGIALDLWSKEELESHAEAPDQKNDKPPAQPATNDYQPQEPARQVSDEPISAMSKEKVRQAVVKDTRFHNADEITAFVHKTIGKDAPTTEQDATKLLNALKEDVPFL